MNDIVKFTSEQFGEIRTVVIDDEPWFVGKDVCKAFGDTNHNRSLGRIDDVDKRIETIEDSLAEANLQLSLTKADYMLCYLLCNRRKQIMVGYQMRTPPKRKKELNNFTNLSAGLLEKCCRQSERPAAILLARTRCPTKN